MNQQETQGTGWLTLMGILLVVFGIIAIAMPAVAGKGVVIAIGIVLLIAGITEIISGLRSEGLAGKLPPLILGLLAVLCGLGLLNHTWLGMKIITLLLIAYFVTEGIWKIIASFNYRPAAGWLAVFASGILSLILGVIIWRQMPEASLWAIGILMGINLIMTGMSMVAVAATVRRLKKLTEDAPAAT